MLLLCTLFSLWKTKTLRKLIRGCRKQTCVHTQYRIMGASVINTAHEFKDVLRSTASQMFKMKAAELSVGTWDSLNWWNLLTDDILFFYYFFYLFHTFSFFMPHFIHFPQTPGKIWSGQMEFYQTFQKCSPLSHRNLNPRG